MTELEAIFAELGLQQYLDDFVDQGFDTWETVLDITESDFDALNVKLGHRRKFQRKIANSRGQSSDTALNTSSRNTPSDDKAPEDPKASSAKVDVKEATSVSQGVKRKYRRHPKPDEHAPERPPSAYVIFSNTMRERLKGQNLSFTEIAKLVGENWQSLQPHEKEPYEQRAFGEKERFSQQMTEYKKTSHYRDFQQYLVNFKARQANTQQVPEIDNKRPKLETIISDNSTSTTEAVSSSMGHGETASGRLRSDSSASNPDQWTLPEGQKSSQLVVNIPHSQISPPASVSAVLPGYRDAIYSHSDGQYTPVWKEGPRDDQYLARIGRAGEIRRSQSGPSSAEISQTPPLYQHAKRSERYDYVPPPLLTRNSTSNTTGSSNMSSHGPRTPMESSLEPISMSHHFQKPGSHDIQLPPILAPSAVSPRAIAVGNGSSPNSKIWFSTAHMIATSQPNSAGHDLRLRDLMSPDNNDLDPVRS
ncbi:hypothetical protein BJ878DRAFT_538253 [Calycina marina]|uniref:HMG box domain-containing protein n=1 Tax=Calycina marina TaxID=1763456 RepID=A0A9P8CIM0_9HELO|nr:hypothetical protein BJ878DRAFT_538253 [Calycina marina]